MQNSNLLVVSVAVIGCLLLQVGFIVVYKNWKPKRHGKRVLATVIQIQIWIEGSYVIADWTDAQTGECYTFRSKRIETHLKQKIGDRILVDFDPHNPARYWMAV